MQNFQQNLAKLEAADTQVLGVSMDSSFSNKAWAEKINVTFPLLSDWGGDVTKEYGLYNPKYKAARRVNYVIDKSGKVVEMQLDGDAIDPTKVVEACQARKLNRYGWCDQTSRQFIPGSVGGTAGAGYAPPRAWIPRRLPGIDSRRRRKHERCAAGRASTRFGLFQRKIGGELCPYLAK
jgi:hypothetical protein